MSVISTGHYDGNKVEYLVGDIVFNPYFGDLYVVKNKVCDTSNKLDDTCDCKFELVQYNDRDMYYMDLDEPANFIILAHKSNRLKWLKYYIILLINRHKIRRMYE